MNNLLNLAGNYINYERIGKIGVSGGAYFKNKKLVDGILRGKFGDEHQGKLEILDNRENSDASIGVVKFLCSLPF